MKNGCHTIHLTKLILVKSVKLDLFSTRKGLKLFFNLNKYVNISLYDDSEIRQGE